MPLSELNAGLGRLMLWGAASGLKVTSCVLITQHPWPLKGNTAEWAHYCHLAGYQSYEHKMCLWARVTSSPDLWQAGLHLCALTHILHIETMSRILIGLAFQRSNAFLFFRTKLPFFQCLRARQEKLSSQDECLMAIKAGTHGSSAG